MGQTPSKFFPSPTPYGQSPDMGVLAQAQAAQPLAQQNFLPLNGATQAQPSQTATPAQTQQGQIPAGFQNPLQRYYGASQYPALFQ